MDGADAETEERNKASIRRFVEEALNQGRYDLIEQTRGEFAEGGKERLRAMRAAFPDIHTMIHPIIAEGDWVAHRMIHTGTHLGEFQGIAPTGRRVEWTSIVMNRFVDGVAVENWGLHDIPKVLRDLQAPDSTP